MRNSLRTQVIDRLPDKVYVPLMSYKLNKRIPNLRNPQRWSDKIQWLKINGHMERFAPYADKYTVRGYIEERIGSKYLVPLLGVWDNFDDIPFDKLPQQFVLKVTHGCGYNYICKDKSTIDMKALKAQITGWQQEDFYKQEREPQYKPCVPRIICETYLEDPVTKELTDYKFYCSKGEPKAVQVDTERFVDHKSSLLGLGWKPLGYVQVATFSETKKLPKKPSNLPEMIRIARKLSEDFPYVRVDLYSVNDRVYFSELTFTPGSGFVSLQPVSGEIEFGKMIDLAAYIKDDNIVSYEGRKIRMKELVDSKKPFISVIIVVKNDRGISRTLRGIKECVFSLPYEVIVVDSSAPEVLADIKEQNRWARWDQYPVSDKRTTPQQRNRGLELSRGDIIAFIDANCEPNPEWLAVIAETIQAGEDIVCGPVNDLSDKNLVHYALEKREAGYVGECTTINVGLRRAVVDRVGNFDERFLFGQDVDFFWRTADAGYKIYFNPKMVIGHDWGDGKEQLNRAYKYGYARARLFKKHWKRHGRQLIYESHVWMYPVFILGLPLTIFIPFYPLLIIVPLLKNRSSNPIGLLVHHLTFGFGVLFGVFSSLS